MSEEYDEDQITLLKKANLRDRDALIEIVRDNIPGLSAETLEWFEDEARKRRSGFDMRQLFVYYTDVLLDPKKGFEYAILASEYGDDLASFHIGEAYQQGDGVACDFDKALKYYLRAWEQGCDWYGSPNPLVPGEGNEKDPVKGDAAASALSTNNFSLSWWLYVLDRHPTPALQYCLGMWFWQPWSGWGWSTENQQDHQKAIALFTAAAEGGSRYAMYQLADIYQTDEFSDEEKAAKWRRSAVAKDA